MKPVIAIGTALIKTNSMRLKKTQRINNTAIKEYCKNKRSKAYVFFLPIHSIIQNKNISIRVAKALLVKSVTNETFIENIFIKNDIKKLKDVLLIKIQLKKTTKI